MSSLGVADWQEISRWVGPTLDQQTALAIGAGTYDTATFQVGSFESVTLVCKPTGGTITATFTSTLSNGPASLAVAQVVRFAAGVVAFKTVPNVGDQLQVHLQGSTAGETIDFALVETNAGGELSSAAQMITGRFTLGGVIVQGTGYTVARTALGNYVVTYAVPFAATPTVIAGIDQSAGFLAVIDATLENASQVRLQAINPGVGFVDSAMSFICTPTL